MNVVYTELKPGNLEALKYLGKKYEGRSEDFAVVVDGKDISKEEAERAVREYFPNCLFAFQDAWKIKSVIGQVKRMYCMSNVVRFAFDLEELGYCKQVYVLMGKTHEDDGWEEDPHTDKLAYKYVRDNLYGCSMQISHEEAETRSKLLGGGCPELQFVKIVESWQGFMFHLFSDAGYVQSNDVCEVLKARIKRMDDTFEVRGQKCEVMHMACQMMDKLQRDLAYQELTQEEKTVAGACAFFYVMMQGMDRAQAICNAKVMLEKLGLECLEKRVVWFMMHCDDFNESMTQGECLATISRNASGGKVPTKQMYDEIFMVKRAEIKGHADIPKVWVRGIAYSKWLNFERRLRATMREQEAGLESGQAPEQSTKELAGQSTIFN